MSRNSPTGLSLSIRPTRNSSSSRRMGRSNCNLVLRSNSRREPGNGPAGRFRSRCLPGTSNGSGRHRMGSGEWSCRRRRGSRSCRWSRRARSLWRSCGSWSLWRSRGSWSCRRNRRARSLWGSSLCGRCQTVGPRSLLRCCRRRCHDGRNHRHNGSTTGASASAVLVLVQPGPKPRLLGLLFLTGGCQTVERR